jgi:hypothetical protein
MEKARKYQLGEDVVADATQFICGESRVDLRLEMVCRLSHVVMRIDMTRCLPTDPDLCHTAPISSAAVMAAVWV